MISYFVQYCNCNLTCSNMHVSQKCAAHGDIALAERTFRPGLLNLIPTYCTTSDDVKRKLKSDSPRPQNYPQNK